MAAGSHLGFPFPVLASDDLLVFVNDMPATGFAISGLADPEGGEITFVEPPAAGTSVTLLRRTESVRETEFVDGGPFRAAAINAELDRIMLLDPGESRGTRARPAAVNRPKVIWTSVCRQAAQRANRTARLRQRRAAADLWPNGAALERRRRRTGWSPRTAARSRARSASTWRPWSTFVTSVLWAMVSPTTPPPSWPPSRWRRRARARSTCRTARPLMCLALLSCSTASTLVGDGAGSTLKLAALERPGRATYGQRCRAGRRAPDRPGANAWPAGPADVDLSGVSSGRGRGRHRSRGRDPGQRRDRRLPDWSGGRRWCRCDRRLHICVQPQGDFIRCRG